VVIFFARGEVIGGLNQLATFVTNDFEAVMSPFGAGCSNLVTWPLKYLEQGRLKAVLGGWDPSDRKFFKARRNHLCGTLGDVRPDGEALPGLLPHPSHLDRGPEKDRPEPQGLERGMRRARNNFRRGGPVCPP